MATSKKSVDAVMEVIKKLSPCEYDDIVNDTGLSYSSVRDAVGLLRTLGHVSVSSNRPALIAFLKEIPKSSTEIVIVEKEIPNKEISPARKAFLRRIIDENNSTLGIAINKLLESKLSNQEVYVQLINAAEVFKEDYVDSDELSIESIVARAPLTN